MRNRFKKSVIGVRSRLRPGIRQKKSLFFIPFLLWGIILPLEMYAGYSITDKDGRVLSGEQGSTLVTGPTNQTIILNDRSNRKVFELFWDAAGGAVMIKGDQVHLKIHSSGKIERWTELETDKADQYPLFIQPEINIGPKPPRSNPNQRKGN
jgi:hypothetical protein